MNLKHKLLPLTVLILSFSLLLSGCHNQVVEKVGVLPDRSTQLVAHNTENEETETEGKSWDVHNADEIRLYTSEMEISERPSSHYFGDTPYLYRTVSQASGDTTYSLEQIQDDGTLTQLHAISIPAGSYFHYSPDGTTAAYETWINNCLTLMLVDLSTNEERVLWQSDEASLLKELQVSARLALQWSPDGSTLLFMPLCYSDGSSDSAKDQTTTITAKPESSVPASAESSTSTEETPAESSVPTDAATETSDSTAPTDDSAAEESVTVNDSTTANDSVAAEDSAVVTAVESLPSISPQEKMQKIHQALPNFPLLYAYELDEKQMQSFLIAPEDYPLYDSATQPMICATQDGSRFFIYFNSPWDPAQAHFLDLEAPLHYSTPLTDYLANFTELSSRPLFYDHLLYLQQDGIGITALDLSQGSVVAQYSFHDPINSFTLYEDTLIVAQPASVGGGVDVTAYLLNLETKQSVLLYHNNETYSPFINHMEISQNGMHLLIEQLPSTYRTQKQLIQLSFN